MTMAKGGWVGAVVASLVLLAGCGGANDGGAPADSGGAAKSGAVTPSPGARQEAQQIFSNRCSVCHGKDGRGDGPAAAGLVPPPRNYHDQAWQSSVTDEEIEQAIVYGGAAVGRSAAMVANPDLGSRPEVVAALRDIIREFGKQE